MIYVTSDLHGIHPDKFQDFLERCGFTDGDFLFILGDVIDRGEHGIPLLLWLTQQSNMQLILGNHEAFLLGCQFLFDEVTEETQEVLGEEELRMLKNWLRNGGSPTILGLQSLFNRDPESVYGIVDYLKDTPLWEQAEAGGQSVQSHVVPGAEIEIPWYDKPFPATGQGRKPCYLVNWYMA
jgi:serine/threonine protein phosphatase 1